MADNNRRKSSDSLGFHDSVFDWGSKAGSFGSSFKKSTSQGSGSTEAVDDPPSSRYDPRAMSRIVDITDLVDDSSSDGSADEDGIVGHSSGVGGVGRPSSSSSSSSSGPGSSGDAKRRPHFLVPVGVGWRQVVVLGSLFAIIATSSLAVGYAVVGSQSSSSSSTYSSSPDDDSSISGRAYMGSGEGEQKLLEIAERVVLACSESTLDGDMSDCRALCHDSMCCFDGGGYSCADDEGRNCAAYAGCSNLMDGVPVGAEEEEDEE
ncbi:hypothetical protein ACHAW5_005238 [Stephanodiscus triporus]|uniref:Uncharacterized protein n=1 Tax=Stephanodiscus triporus TaxID=2934178 RepID=A0ABD3Q3B6_9STRA